MISALARPTLNARGFPCWLGWTCELFRFGFKIVEQKTSVSFTKPTPRGYSRCVFIYLFIYLLTYLLTYLFTYLLTYLLLTYLLIYLLTYLLTCLLACLLSYSKTLNVFSRVLLELMWCNSLITSKVDGNRWLKLINVLLILNIFSNEENESPVAKYHRVTANLSPRHTEALFAVQN